MRYEVKRNNIVGASETMLIEFDKYDLGGSVFDHIYI